MRLSPLIPLLLLVAACDTDDNPPLGLQVEMPNRDRKFGHHQIPKRVAIVRGKVVSATGVPVIGAHVKVAIFFVDFDFRDGFENDRCHKNLTHVATSTNPAGDFVADVAVDAAVPEICVVVSVVPSTFSGLRPTIVKVENVLPVLNTGLSPIPTVLVNIILLAE